MSADRPHLPAATARMIRNLRLGFAAIAMLVTVFGTVVGWQSWKVEKEHEQLYLMTLGRMTGNTLDDYFQRYQRSLLQLADEFAARDPVANRAASQALLKQMVAAYPGLRRIGISRPDGQFLITDSVKLGSPLPSVAGNPSFAAALEELRGGQKLSIGRATKSVVDGEWIIPLRCGVRDAGGGIRYILTAALPVASQQRFWQGMPLPAGSSIGLLRDDMYLVSRYPAPTTMSYDEAYGKPRDGALATHLRLNGFPAAGVIEGYNSVAKADYLFAFQRLSQFPATVFVTASVASVWDRWWQQSRLSFVAALAFLAGAYAVYRWSLRRQMAWERERSRREEEIQYLAHHDSLTGLPNRTRARDRLEQALAFADRASAKVALVFVDLDNFKSVNDSLGHTAGDVLLADVAERLRLCIRETDTLSRQGGDEFLIVLANVDEPGSVARVAEAILQRMSQPFYIDGLELFTSLSMGVAVYPDDGRDFETLLKKADTAMYQAKGAGRNTYRFYTEQMNIDAEERLRLRQWLRQGLDQGHFVLHYQPQIDLRTGAVVGAEALLRLDHPGQGLIAPASFIPVAEDSGLIVPIGQWVLREACRQAAAWRRAGAEGLVMAVNLSAAQFRRGDLVEQVLAALEGSGLPATALELELTESVLMENAEHVLDTMGRLTALGIRFAIDDFGTGYSSLAYLKRFNIHTLKIDRSFVRDVIADPEDATIVRAVIQMAHGLNLTVVAEGVEDAATRDYLVAQGCDQAQGYFHGRPVPAGEFPVSPGVLARSA